MQTCTCIILGLMLSAAAPKGVDAVRCKHSTSPRPSLPPPAAPPVAPDDRRTYNTLGHYYGSTKPVASNVVQLDHGQRRRQRVVEEVVEV